MSNKTQKIEVSSALIWQVTVYTPDKVVDVFYQYVLDQWVPYKRVVHSVR